MILVKPNNIFAASNAPVLIGTNANYTVIYPTQFWQRVNGDILPDNPAFQHNIGRSNFPFDQLTIKHIHFLDENTDFIIHLHVPVLLSNVFLILPSQQADSPGQVLTNDGNGFLGWWTPISGPGGPGLTTNNNQFLGVPLSIKSFAQFTNIVIWRSNDTSVALLVTNLPGSTLDLVQLLTTNGAGLKVTSNGAVIIRGTIGTTTNVFEVRNTNDNKEILSVTHSNSVRIVGPQQSGYGASLQIMSEAGSVQNNIELWAGNTFSGRWRSDNAGNQNISAGGSGIITFNPDDGSGEVRFQVPGVGIVWDLIPSADVAAWHGGIVRRAQLTNVWDFWGRTNLWLTRTGLLNGLVVTQDIRFLGHNSTSNFIWTCTNSATGEGEWRGNVIPAANNIYRLGDSTFRWASLAVQEDGIFLFENSGGNDFVNIFANNVNTAYQLILPEDQGAVGTTLTNDGSGSLGWWNPYFGGTNIYRFNINQFGINNVTNISIKESPLFTNVVLYSSDTNRTNVAINQTIGQAVPVLSFRDSNGAPALEIDNRGFLIVTNSLTNRIPAPTNTIAQGADNFAGLSYPNWIDDKGMPFWPQHSIAHDQVYWSSHGNGSSLNNVGTILTTFSGATISHPDPTESQVFMADLASPASSNATAGGFSAAPLANSGAHDGSSKIGGYFFMANWSITNNISGIVGGGASKTFVGLAAAAVPNLTNIVNETNATGQYIGLYSDTKNSLEMFISSRDSVAEFRTNTGINFVATNVYRFSMFNSHTSRFVGWRLDNRTAGTTANGWFSNNVPTNFMRFGIMTKNGTNRAHHIRYSRLYLEAPLSPR